jgi:hypothetical protein
MGSLDMAPTAWQRVSKNHVEYFIEDVYEPKPERSNEPTDKSAYYPQAGHSQYMTVPAQAQGPASYYGQQSGVAGPSYYQTLANPPPSAVYYSREQREDQSNETLFPPATQYSPVYPENPLSIVPCQQTFCPRFGTAVILGTAAVFRATAEPRRAAILQCSIGKP